MKKVLSVLLTLALVANLTAIVFVNAVATESQQTKVFNFLDSYTAEELAELTADPDDYYVSVFVEFAYPEMDTDGLDELDRPSRNAAIRNYHMMQNLAIATQLGIPADAISSYAPYAELRYESIAAYEAAEDFVYSLGESEDVQDVEIELCIPEDCDATKATNPSSSQFSFSQAFEAVGITDTGYDGTGIRVGVMEQHIPDDRDHIPIGHYVNYGDVEGDHATRVTQILVGDLGVAEDIFFYCVSTESFYTSDMGSELDSYPFTFRYALEWLMDNHVDIVNISYGLYTTGLYDNRAAYIDYLISTTGCTFVLAAGNSGEFSDTDARKNCVASPATSASAITVGAINAQNQVTYQSPYITVSFGNNKPDLVAPGENILFPWALGTIPKSGTSYAAPIVSGIAARLMQEYPILKTKPYLLKAVLLASCTNLPGQDEQIDTYAGCGLVNYARARSIMASESYFYYEKPANNYPNGVYLFDTFINYVPAGRTVNLHYTVQIPGAFCSVEETDTSGSPFAFSKFKLHLYDQETNQKVADPYNVDIKGSLPFEINYVSVSNYQLVAYMYENNHPTQKEYIAFAYTYD